MRSPVLDGICKLGKDQHLLPGVLLIDQPEQRLKLGITLPIPFTTALQNGDKALRIFTQVFRKLWRRTNRHSAIETVQKIVPVRLINYGCSLAEIGFCPQSAAIIRRRAFVLHHLINVSSMPGSAIKSARSISSSLLRTSSRLRSWVPIGSGSPFSAHVKDIVA